jgi:hypothetical protein
MCVRLTAVALAALAACLSASATAARTPTPTQLALMPLPKAQLGAGALSLPLDRSSGVVTNAEAADDSNGDVTAAKLERLGRRTGYTLDYSDPGGAALAAGRGLLEVETSVDLYADEARARQGMAFWRHDETDTSTMTAVGIEVELAPVAAPAVGDERWAYAGTVFIKGKPPIYGADVYFRRGVLVASVSVSAADAKSVRPLATALARKLDVRIGQVLAGRVKGPPVPLPGKGRAGPPRSGVDLAAMALRPKDLGGGKVTTQGYRLDPDLTPVSEYRRSISGSVFASFQEQVIVLHSPTEASLTLTVLASSFASGAALRSGDTGPKSDRIVRYSATRVAVRYGDESRAVLANVRFGDGRVVNEGFVFVRTGSTIAFVLVATPASLPIPQAAVVGLTRVTAQRLAAGAHRVGVA